MSKYGGYATDYGVSEIYNNYLDEEEIESNNKGKENQSFKDRFLKKLNKFLNWIDN